MRRVIDASHPLLLASASPRRRQLLETLGLPLRVAPADVDESERAGETADAYLERVVAAKLQAAVRDPRAATAGAALVADTAVVLEGRLLHKPTDDADGARMLRALSGRAHQVRTRFALAPTPPSGPGSVHVETVVTTVCFRALEEEEIAGYVRSGEGRDKAGGYAIQGIGGFAIERIEGSYSNVVGLPVCEVVLALRRTGALRRFPLP
jgi:septum formation protein